MSAAGAVRADQASLLRSLIERAPANSAAGGDGAARPGRPPTIAIASGKGGVGKTVLSVSIAASLAKRMPTVLVDADFGAANADVMLGVAPLRRLDECFQRGFAAGHGPVDIAIEAAERLWLVPGVIGARFRPLPAERRVLVEQLDRFGDDHGAIVVDTPAGVGRSVTEWLAAADCPLIVTTCEPTAIADAYALLKSVRAEHGVEAASRVRLVLNQVEASSAGQRAGRRTAARIAAVADRFLGCRPELIAMVPFDKRLRRGVMRQRPAALERHGGAGVRAAGELAERAAKIAEHAQLLRTSPRRSASQAVADRRRGTAAAGL